MKLHNLRTSTGAVLGLFAASLFIIVAIGVFMYFAGSLLGGSYELNRASDAGILSVAKQALVQPAVALNDSSLPGFGTLPYNDFAVGSTSGNYYIPDQQINGYPAIDLLTYNRCAAQAVLVGLNAQSINVPASLQHAQAVAQAVAGLGLKLQQAFTLGTLNNYFDTTANQNTLNFLGGDSTVSRINNANIGQTYVAAGRPSNIYFYPDVVNPLIPSNALAQIPQNTNPTDAQPNQLVAKINNADFPNGEVVYYASGYSPIQVMAGTPQASIISFVPNDPQANPHLVNKERAEASMTPPFTWIPPNAFIDNAQAQVNITGNARKASNKFVNAVSCAMIGCGELAGLPGIPLSTTGIGGGPQDQAARIPGAFVRVYNLPGMEALSLLPLGPLPATAGLAYDGSNFILNNSAIGIGNQTLYIGMDLPMTNGVVNTAKVVFADTPAGKAALLAWINFDTSRLVSTNPNAELVNGQYLDSTLDPNKSPNTSQLLAAGKNPTIPNLYEGSSLNGPAYLNNVLGLSGYVESYAAELDGTTPVQASNGNSVSASNMMLITTGIAGSNLGQPAPHKLTVPVPYSNRTWSSTEYMKDAVIGYWANNFSAGHYQMTAPQSQLITGVKSFNFWLPNGELVQEASPNKGGTLIPSQFMTVSNPYNLLTGVDNQIQHEGGYQNGQVTFQAMLGSLTNLVRMINPRWNQQSLITALASMDSAPGDMLYLRDDGNGNLILSNTCPQDTGVPAEATLSNSVNTNQLVAFQTQPGQFVQLTGNIINTSIDTSQPTAQTADATLEKQPWLDTNGIIQYDQGAILYKSSGYNNCLGEMDLYSRPSADVNVNFYHPN